MESAPEAPRGQAQEQDHANSKPAAKPQSPRPAAKPEKPDAEPKAEEPEVPEPAVDEGPRAGEGQPEDPGSQGKANGKNK